MQCVPGTVGVVESPPEFVFAVMISGDVIGRWIRDVGEDGPDLGFEEIPRPSFLVFVVSFMSDIDTSRCAATNTSVVDVGALSIFTGNLEVDAVCSCWDGSSLLRERFVNPSTRGDPALPPSTGRSGIAKLDEASRPQVFVG